MRNGKTVVHGHRLYWERHGSLEAPVVLLLHHGLGSVRAWRHQIPALVEAGWGALAYDRWGYGRSDPRPRFTADYHEQDKAEAFALLDHLGIRRFALVGHSDGGTIAILMAAEQPERVARLVLIAAHIYCEPKTMEGVEEVPETLQRPRVRRSLAREHGERAESLVYAWMRPWVEGELRDWDIRDRLARISCPTLVVQGVEDEHATPQHAVDIAAGIPDSDLWLIPEVGHMPTHEVPEELNRRLVAFLAPALEDLRREARKEGSDAHVQ